MNEIVPLHTDTNLTHHVYRAAFDLAISIPEGLALLYWNHEGECRAFPLNDGGGNFHFAVASLRDVYHHRSEIIPV